MSWATGKAAIAARLATIAITSPVALTTSVVYQNPPASISDTVSWVLFPPRIRPVRSPGGWRTNVYRYRARLFVNDVDHARASLLVENIVEATIDSFDNQSALRTGGIQIINGPEVDEPGVIRGNQVGAPSGAVVWHVADCLFEIHLSEDKTFT